MKFFKLEPIDIDNPKFKATSIFNKPVLVQALDENEAREIADMKFAIYHGYPDKTQGVWKKQHYVAANELSFNEYSKLKFKMDAI
ncbi:hypothetical protein L3V83_14105 [Thiotrichales bacterium 19X7-9]|nr:hypothetical protein [Thiotrichales bacterium 19X7-9]